MGSISERMVEFKVDEEFNGKVKLVDQDVAAKLKVIIGICNDNLDTHAIKYGVAPCTGYKTEDNLITVKLIDQGELTRKDWRQCAIHLLKPVLVGLTIVEL